jgi:hypothetical protein
LTDDDAVITRFKHYPWSRDLDLELAMGFDRVRTSQ